MLPNFIVIGAGKSGTTTLYEWLKKHPEIFMSEVKETNFFALEGEDISGENDPLQLRHYPWSVTDRAAYESLFDQAAPNQVRGEVSPMYLYSHQARTAIKQILPNVKLIAILRNPVDRLHSRYSHLVRESRQPADDYSDVFNRDSIWWKRNDLVREGLYGTHLSRYFQLFPENQIRVYLFDDLKNRPAEVLKDIYSYLEVDPSFLPDLEVQHNPSGKIKNPIIDKLIGQNSILKSSVNTVAPKLIQLAKDSDLIQKTLLKLRKRNLEKIPMNEKFKRLLYNRIYHNEVIALQKLINRDLSHWMY